MEEILIVAIFGFPILYDVCMSYWDLKKNKKNLITIVFTDIVIAIFYNYVFIVFLFKYC